MTLERHLEELTRSLAERTIADRPAIRLNELIGNSLPKAVSTYIQAEVLRALEQDLRNGSALRHIDRHSPGMQQLITSFARSLSYAYTFDRDEYLQTLDDAVHFAANYLFRPRWTLEQFLFEEQPSAPLATIEHRLSYVTDYTYLGELLLRILRRRGSAEVMLEETRTLLARIDDQVVQQHSPRELVHLTRPIFLFMLQGDETTDRPIPIEPLLLFFEDKKMKFLKDYLEGIVSIRKASGLSFGDLSVLVEDLYNAESRPGQVPAGAPVEAEPEEPSVPELPLATDAALQPSVTPDAGGTPEPEETPHPDRAPEPEETPQPEDPTGPEEMPQRDQAPNPEESSPPDVSRGAIDTPEAPAVPINPALSLTFAGMVESRAARLPGLGELISDQQRKRFVKRIFHRDADYYLTVLRALDEMPDWDQAASYLKEFYRTNELDPFSGDVVEFTDIVQQRFQKGTR